MYVVKVGRQFCVLTIFFIHYLINTSAFSNFPTQLNLNNLNSAFANDLSYSTKLMIKLENEINSINAKTIIPTGIQQTKNSQVIENSRQSAGNDIIKESMPPYIWKFLMLGVCILWSTNFAVVKGTLDSIPDGKLDPPLYASIRFTIAALVMFPQTINLYKKENINLIQNGLFLGLFNFLGYVGQSIGLQTSTANKSAFICSIVVVWVALITSIREKKFKPQTWLSVILAVVGAAIIELNGSQFPVLGDLWLLLQPVGFGTAYILLEPIMKKYPNNAAAVTSFRLITVSLCSICWSILTGHTLDDLKPILNSQTAVSYLLYTGLVTTAGGLWLSAIAFKRVPATEAAIIIGSEPIWAAVAASVLLGENLTIHDSIGGGIIILACLSYQFNVVERFTGVHSEKTT